MGKPNEPLTPVDGKDVTTIISTFRARATDARKHAHQMRQQIQVTEMEAMTWDTAADELEALVTRAINAAWPIVTELPKAPTR